jgi:hypothetical protein
MDSMKTAVEGGSCHVQEHVDVFCIHTDNWLIQTERG